MAKKRKLKAIESSAIELIQKSLNLANMHIDNLTKKMESGEISTQESYALCSYLKTFSYIEKNQKSNVKDLTKIVSKMTDEELEQELKKHKELFLEEILNDDEDEIKTAGPNR